MNKYDKRHIQNRVRYERQIEALFDAAMLDTAKLTSVIGDLGDEPFSWNNYPLANTKIKGIIAQLKSNLTASIVNAVRSEWTLSNNKNNELCNQVFGSLADSLPEALSRRYYSNNEQARDAFIARKNRGLNLSDRVWKYTNQFKTEIEMALDIGIRDGKSSAYDIVRDLKEYLKYPDRLYRRVRDEHGFLHLSKKAKAFHPGRGVYRSSYMNARRLAATETNIAYRTADYLRWQQMDFVVGIEIKTSNNHPITDICDTFAGRYPKDFKFTGWHPLCRCHAVTILKTEDELAEDTQRILDGGEPQSGSVNEVTDVPGVFSKWVENNEDRISRAEKRGSLPYFITDNHERVDRLLGKGEKSANTTTIRKHGSMKLGRASDREFEAILNDEKYNTIASLSKAVDNDAEALCKELNVNRRKMTLKDADRGSSNPYKDRYNCQSCVAVYEARRRGIDVFARPFEEGGIADKLGDNGGIAFVDANGMTPKIKEYKGDIRKMEAEIKKDTKAIGRYHIGGNNNGYGHIFVAERLDKDTFILYDPQKNVTYKLGDILNEYKSIEILRVDNLRFNHDVLKAISQITS